MPKRQPSIALLAILLAAPSHAQTPAATSVRATFEVASVKRNTSGDLRQSWDREPGGRVVHINFTLRDLVRDAYGLRDQQLAGGPDWFDREHFDVIARGPAAAEAQAARRALRAAGALGTARAGGLRARHGAPRREARTKTAPETRLPRW
jgi:hypothetical protein